MSNFYDMIRERVKSFIKEYRMIDRGDTVCVGLSGGADSVCLLAVLCDLSEELGFKVTAFHVNHSLRGDDSDADEEYAAGLCRKMKVPLKEFTYDIAMLAIGSKKGLEETGRIMRRKAAKEAAEHFGAKKIALAHHANDNAETVLFNLARGSSAGGLKGILPVNGQYIRPLLFIERKEIEEELKERGIPWREDVTNQSTDYSRNMLRNVIIPELARSINAGTVRHINEAAADMAEAYEMIKEQADLRLSEFSLKTEQGVLLKNGVMTDRRLVNGRIALSALESVTHSAVDLERVHAGAIADLFRKQPGRVIELPYMTEALRVYEGVLIRKRKKDTDIKDARVTDEMPLKADAEFGFNGLEIRTRLFNYEDTSEKIPEKRYTKWFDYDKITRYGLFRTRRAGDFLVINSEGGKKKLKAYFINEKIPKEERDNVVCLAAGSEIIWAVGYRIGETAKITKDTKRILEISVVKEGTHE